MKSSIVTFIEQRWETAYLTKKKQKELEILVMHYIFKLVSASQFKKMLKNILPDANVIEISREILRDGYIMKNIKLWYYYVAYNGLARTRRWEVAQEFEIKEEDIPLLSLMPQLNDELQKKILTGGPALTLAKYERNCEKALERVHTFTAKFVHRKMRFIVEAQGMEFRDIIQELKADGLQALHFTYPKVESFEHCKNIMKRSIHNAGINFIEFYSGKKRSKSDGKGNNLAIPIWAAEKDDAMTPYLSTSIDNSEKDFVEKETVRKLLASFTGKRQKFLNLLMHYDEQFSKWLNEKGYSKLSNDEYMDRCKDIKTYINWIMEYLGVEQAKGHKLIEKLRMKLA